MRGADADGEAGDPRRFLARPRGELDAAGNILVILVVLQIPAASVEESHAIEKLLLQHRARDARADILERRKGRRHHRALEEVQVHGRVHRLAPEPLLELADLRRAPAPAAVLHRPVDELRGAAGEVGLHAPRELVGQLAAQLGPHAAVRDGRFARAAALEPAAVELRVAGEFDLRAGAGKDQSLVIRHGHRVARRRLGRGLAIQLHALRQQLAQLRDLVAELVHLALQAIGYRLRGGGGGDSESGHDQGNALHETPPGADETPNGPRWQYDTVSLYSPHAPAPAPAAAAARDDAARRAGRAGAPQRCACPGPGDPGRAGGHGPRRPRQDHGLLLVRALLQLEAQLVRAGRAVISAGPNRGRPKEVGITAARTKARPGVIAADTNLFAFGTVLLRARLRLGARGGHRRRDQGLPSRPLFHEPTPRPASGVSETARDPLLAPPGAHAEGRQPPQTRSRKRTPPP
jgi:hypothetical protein